MCGIAGLILTQADPVVPSWLTAMTQRLHHRGPDDGGAVVFGPQGRPVVERRLGDPSQPVDWGAVSACVGLGARRLAIIDLSPAGHQPMASPDGSVWLAYNGEIYNHPALADELRGRGLSFVGRSDTEVLLGAYRAWGTACFERLDGMWAAAVVDWSARRAVLSRDRLGIKPLYIALLDGGLAFASEIKALLELPGLRRAVNKARLHDFLARGLTDHTNETFFEGVWSVPPGCWLGFDLSERSAANLTGVVRRYWRPCGGWQAMPDAAERIRDGLTDAVQSHLRSDVPVGSCLSGGLDSSAIVSIIHRLAGRQRTLTGSWAQHTFTACLPGSPLDESRYAERVVQSCPGLRWHRVEPTAARLLNDVERLVWHQEQPFGSPSIYMQWEVMRQARADGVTVLLDGQGGDELFCGYEGYWPPYLAHLLRRGRGLTFAREFANALAFGSHHGAGSLAGHVGAYLLPDRWRDRLRQAVSTRRQDWIARDLDPVAPTAPPLLGHALRLANAEGADWNARGPALSRRLWRIVLAESLPSLLRFEDRNSMAFSVEARVPMLDQRLVELAMSLPPELKIRDGRLKAVLREAMQAIVPDEIRLRRDKIGFAAPTTDWMRRGLDVWWRDLLSSQSFRERGWFDAAGAKRLIANWETGDEAAAPSLWRLAVTEQWARQFL